MSASVGRKILLAVVLSLVACGAAGQTNWPTKPITYVVPYPPGGTTDILGRTITQRLTSALGQPIVVDNKAGATGTIGGAFVARAAPDGYTLLGTSIGPQTIVPHLMPKMQYDPAKAYEPVIMVGTVPHVLVVAVTAPYKTVAELVAAAKANPGGITFASGGNGTILQMQGEMLRLQSGTEMTHVPYKGDIPAMQDVMSGQATLVFVPVAAALPQIQGGRLRALAVTTAERLKALPQVPTMTELGYKDFVVEQWQAIYAPAGTPPAIVGKLNDEIGRILKDPAVVTTLDKAGVTIVGGAPQQLAQQQAADFERWGRIIKAANIKLD